MFCVEKGMERFCFCFVFLFSLIYPQQLYRLGLAGLVGERVGLLLFRGGQNQCPAGTDGAVVENTGACGWHGSYMFPCSATQRAPSFREFP